jgi:mannitol-specific phosphotransferase system IIBC component
VLRAKLYAIGAAIVGALLFTIKILTMQKEAAQEEARRAKKHMNEVKEISKVEKKINAEVKQAKQKAVEQIKNGEMPDNIRNRNQF